MSPICSLRALLSLLALTLAICRPCWALDERRTLVEFFEATNGAQWLVKDNWGSDAPICSWKGISCLGGSLSGDSEVDTIQLPENNIAGAIPASLFSMPLLRFLDLEGNPLTNAGFEGFQLAEGETGVTVSPIETLALNGCNLRDVTGIGHAPSSLRDLRLASNSLNGEFPDELFQVTTLKRLFLDQNAITGTIPTTIGNMQMLIDFHAIAVPFQSRIPSEFGLLTNLVTMVLRDNEFTGTIPTELNNMMKLEILSIGRSPEAGQGQLAGPLPSFAKLPYLELLDLSLNRLNGTIPRDFLLGNQRTDDLVIVRLDGNMLTGTLPKQLGWIDSLDLGVTGNQFVSPIPQELCEKKQWMTGLVEQFACDAIVCPSGTYNEGGKHTLTAACQPCEGPPSPYLGQTKCSGASAYTDQPWRILAEFYLALDGKSWANQDGWAAIDTVLGNSRISDLQSTDLDYCNFMGVTCTQKGDVQEIELFDNILYGTIPPSVFLLPMMTTFNVSSNHVTIEKDGFEAIASTNVLSKLVLSHTDVTSLAGLQATDSMEELYLDGVSFQSNLTNDLFTLTNLRILDFQNSNMQGTIPANVGNMKSLVR
jgi:Leucine-rich repeat (LRR) protein